MLKRLSCMFMAMVLLCSVSSYAQKQNNNWCFAKYRGFDFNSGTPVPFTSAILAEENCATVSDRNTGALLFYTNGLKIWDKNHNIMPTGSTGIGLDTIYSAAQGTVVACDISDINKYYVFTVEPNYYANTRGRLRYSVVDMSLNGGMGDVVA